MLQIENLTKKYNKTLVFDDISLTLNNGVNVLLAPNGYGKTTLMKIIAKLIKPNKGDILIKN